MTSFDKKIQKRAWSHNSYRFVRGKINNFLEDKLIQAPRTKKKRVCKINKSKHIYIIVEEVPSYLSGVMRTLLCRCGKKQIQFIWNARTVV